MRLRAVAAAVAAGVAAFLLVGVAVTELLAARIAFSALVGLPAGLFAGVAVTALVLVGLGGEDPRQRALAAGVGTAGVVGLAVLAVLIALGRTGAALSLALAAVAGLLAGVAVLVRRQ
jgi:hypothetical protein